MAATRRAKAAKSTFDEDSSLITVPESDPAPSRSRGLVFISHDSRDADLAEAFSNLLTDVSAGILKSFRASDKKGTSGIPFGTEWYQEIMAQISGASDVVALLTSQSVERPWILYEAGVAKGKLNTTVFGVALGVPLDRVSTGPFAQFQNCDDDAESLTKLAIQLLSRNPDTAPREAAVRMQVDLFKQKVQAILEARGTSLDSDSTSDSAKLFEEIKEMVRSLNSQIEERIGRGSFGPRGRRRRFHPMMVDELIHHPRFGRDDNGATALLVVLSIFRDDIPWLYEPGMEFYRALRSGSVRAASRARKHFINVLHVADHPMLRDMQRESDEDSFLLMHDLPHFIEHTVRRIQLSSRRPPKGVDGGQEMIDQA